MEMQFGTGAGPKIALPGFSEDEAWVRLRKLDWDQSDEYDALGEAGYAPAEPGEEEASLRRARYRRRARRYLVEQMVCEYRVPAGNGGNGVGAEAPPTMGAGQWLVSAPEDSPEARRLNGRQLATLDEERRAWLLEQCLRANGELAAATAMDLERRGVRVNEERMRAALEHIDEEEQARSERERVLGELSASPEPSGEASPDESAPSPNASPISGEPSGT